MRLDLSKKVNKAPKERNAAARTNRSRPANLVLVDGRLSYKTPSPPPPLDQAKTNYRTECDYRNSDNNLDNEASLEGGHQ